MKSVYIIRKYVVASSAKEAIKKEKGVNVHDCWLDESSQKDLVAKVSEGKNIKGFGFK